MSIFDVHDSRNYHPIRTTWEVQGKAGNRWDNLGVHTCVGDLTAARHLRGNYKTVRVRKAAEHGINPSAWRKIHFVSTHAA